jgi:hypothetical protein
MKLKASMTKLHSLTSLALILLGTSIASAQTTPEAVLAKAARYHDPQHEWPTLKATFHFTETRPDGEGSSSSMVLDNERTYMKVDMGGKESYEITVDSAKVLSGDKDPERGLRIRNYFLYLWGLPMKLYDEGTPFDPKVTTAEVNGITCDVIRVAYEKDTWYFSIDQTTGRMVQYKFYQDETAGKGEVITLEGEIKLRGLTIPQKRNWYTLPAKKYLGTDILSRLE